MSRTATQGPLAGLKVLEIASLAPGPFGCMLLADLGAEVLRVDRAVPKPDGAGLRSGAVTFGGDVLGRGRRAIAVDIKSPAARELILQLVEQADVIVEGFRPGTMERLGLGPDVCLERNPRLVYGRMTGWGQEGPLAPTAGHDINYIAVSGALHMIGPAGGKPVPPANLLGDFAGGGLLLAFGILAALHERTTSGRGQVVDAAMVDGAAITTTFLHGLLQEGSWTDDRGVNMLDGAAPFYGTYETADGRYVALGAIEPHFYAELIQLLGLADAGLGDQNDTSAWPAHTARFAEVFRTKTRDEWCAVFEGSDACFAPVLSMTEAPLHDSSTARSSFVEINGFAQPAPAPRFSRTPAAVPAPPPVPDADGHVPLLDWGIPQTTIDAALETGGLAG